MRHRRLITLLVGLLATACAAARATTPTVREYNNPILGGFHPDPSICRVGDDYYLVTSSFAYFPGIPIFTSRDLVHWRSLGYVLTRESQLPLGHASVSSGIWAPTIRHHAGVFYVVSTNMSGRHGNFYVTARDPAGPWSEPVWFDPEGWDPSLFFDDDDTAYVARSATDAHGGGGIAVYALDLTSGKPRGASRVVWDGGGFFGPEGPHIYKRAGFYYLMIAAGGTHVGHLEAIARARTVWGPYESCPHNPILTQREHIDRRIQATGHADLVEAKDGSWWLVFLGIRNYVSFLHPNHLLGRETFLAPVTWGADGWPVVNDGKTIEEAMRGPLPAVGDSPRVAPRDDFAGAALATEWNFLRRPAPLSLSETRGWLTLHGDAATLDSNDGGAFVGRRQEHPKVHVATRLDFTPVHDGDEAGLTAFMAERYHYDVGVRMRSGRRELFVHRRSDDIDVDAVVIDAPAGPIVLEAQGNPWSITFSWRDGNGATHALAKLSAKYLATEFVGGFTGLFWGLYATGRGQPAAAPARFDWFDYEPLPL